MELIDRILAEREPDGRLFAFSYRQALRLMGEWARSSGATTMPDGEPVRWKDLRSGMACNLLSKGWTSDEVNARLGHAPNSDGLNRYINFMALRRDEPKQRMMAKVDRQNGAGPSVAKAGRTVITCPHCNGVLAGLGLPTM